MRSKKKISQNVTLLSQALKVMMINCVSVSYEIRCFSAKYDVMVAEVVVLVYCSYRYQAMEE